jgi:hypothetical protein
MSEYAIQIVTAAHDLLAVHFGARFKTYRKTPMLQVQPSDLPLLGIYILREQGIPLGDANHAEPKFKSTLTVGFSGAVHADTDDQNKLYQLEETMSEVLDVLLTNPKFVNLAEGFTGTDRQSQYAKVGETTLFEIRIELQALYDSWFDPVVVDDFNTLHITNQYPPGVDPDTVLQIIRVYELNTARRRSNGGQRPHHPRP